MPTPPKPTQLPQEASEDTLKLDMTSRYLGLVVVPGEYVTKIEVEEFASQVREKAEQAT